MIKFISNKKGFSLIELMVVVVILGLMVLGLVTFFTGGARSWISGQSQLEAQRNARQAMDQMVREIRLGQSVTKTPNNYSITVDVPPLPLDLNTYSDAYSVTFSWSGTDGAPLQRVVNGTPNELLASIYKIEFGVNGNRVDILLQMDLDDDKNPDITLKTDVNLRNFGLE